MGFTSQDDLISSVTVDEQFQYDVRFKTISTAQVAAFWTNLGVFAGSEPASAYPGTSLTFVPTDDTWADGAWQHGGAVASLTKPAKGSRPTPHTSRAKSSPPSSGSSIR